MRTFKETVEYLKFAEKASTEHLDLLLRKGDDARTIRFEQEHRKRIRDTLAAVQEVLLN